MAHIEASSTRPSTGRRDSFLSGLRTRQPPPWLVQLAAVLVVVVATGVYLQLAHPFLRHDDWEFTIDRGQPGAGNIFGRNKYEGRWLTWVYWGVIGQRTTIVAAMAIFFAAYTAYVWGMVRLFDLRRPLHVFLAMSAFMVSVVWVEVAYWPGTLSPAMLIAAAAVWTLPLARRRPVLLVTWLGVFTVLSLLAYQPVAALVLLAAAVSERASSLRRLVVLGVGYVVACGVGVLIMNTLNLLAFGRFGLTLSAWRHPNPLDSLSALAENLGRYGRQFFSLSLLVGLAGLVGLACLVWGLVERRTRRWTLVAAVAVAIVIALESGLTVATGVITGTRASLWAWPAICIPAIYLLRARRTGRMAAVVALIVISVVGTVSWRSSLGEHQATRAQYDALADDVAAAAAAHPGQPVVMWTTPKLRATAAGSMTATTVANVINDRHGIFPPWCSPSECRSIAGAVARRPAGGVAEVDGLVVVLLPDPPTWL